MNEEIGVICGLRSCRAWWSRHKSLFDDHDHMIPCAATPGISQIFKKELLAGIIKLVVFGFVFFLKWWKETASLFKISGGRAEQGAMISIHDVTSSFLEGAEIRWAVYTPTRSKTRLNLLLLLDISIDEGNVIVFTWLLKKQQQSGRCRTWLFAVHVKAHGGHVLARLCPAQRFIIQHHGQWRRPQGQARDLWLLYWDYWLGHMASPTEIKAGLLSNVTRVITPFPFYICYDHLKAAYGSEKPVQAPSLSLPATLLSSPRQPPLESIKVSAALTHLEQQNWLSLKVNSGVVN